MSHTTQTLSLAIALVLLPSLAQTMEKLTMSDTQKDILATVEHMTQAFHRSDIDGVMDSYEEEAVVVFEPGQPMTDPARIKEMFQGAFSLNPRFDYSGHEVYVAGDIAVHFAPWSMNGATPDGQKVNQSGLSVAVLRRQNDGSWRMVIDNPHGQRLMQQN